MKDQGPIPNGLNGGGGDHAFPHFAVPSGPGAPFQRPDLAAHPGFAYTRQAPTAPAPAWALPRVPSPAIPVFELVLGIIGLFCVELSVIGYVLLSNVLTVGLVAFLAIAPLVAVLTLFIYLDRWEREPPQTLFATFMWGAGVAIIGASFANSLAYVGASLRLQDEYGAMAFTAVTVAPVVEETMKGLGVLLVVYWRRNEINSIVDGIVYAGVIGAGFAFIENMQYFIEASQESAAMLTLTVIMRGVFSPFIHPMATSLSGFALAWAVVRAKNPGARIMVPILGWLGAILVHSLWNLLGTIGNETWLAGYLLIEVPLFIAWMSALLVISSRDAVRIRRGLAPYVVAGWVLPAEAELASSSNARRFAKRWIGKERKRIMNAFLVELSLLGLDQDLQMRVGPHPLRVLRDQEVLRSMTAHRLQILSAPHFHHGLR